uniref:Uncharacterized protein n=1 Tax=Aureoumbra lagunensis TaxID=44058 RepID=A0A7S3K2B0_9STRA
MKELDAIQLRRYGVDGSQEQNGLALRRRSATRCNPKRDSGITVGKESGNVLFCIDFARGCCSDGSECSHRHEIPKFPQDEANPHILNSEFDIFGRKRSILLTAWEKAQRRKEHGANTLDLAALELSNIRPPQKQRSELCGGTVKQDRSVAALLDIQVRKAVGQFGDIADLRIHLERGLTKPAKVIVVFKGRTQAEFAKEALTNQGLVPESRELLQVKWAPFEQSVPFDLQPTKAPYSANLTASIYTNKNNVQVEDISWDKYLDATSQRYYWANRFTLQTTWTNPEDQGDKEEHEDKEENTREEYQRQWTPHLDPRTGATYWAHNVTKEVTWLRPHPT